MKNLCILAHGLGYGGAERVASILANYFDDNGYNVTYICAFHNQRSYKINSNIKVYFIDSKRKNRVLKMIDRKFQINKIVKKNKIDEMISFITGDALLPQIMGVKTIHTLRCDPYKIDNTFFKARLRNFLYKHSKKVVFQIEGAMDYFSSKIKKKGVIIPNPLDIERLPEWNVYNKSNTFVTACRLTEQKNLPLMIEAFCEFNKDKKYNLDVYGDGEEKESLKKLIEDKKANSFIHLKGYTESIFDVLKESMAFVLTSDYEGLSNSMLEALCIGIPCICTDSPPGGAREYINENNGILIPIKDKEKLVEAFQKICLEENKEKYLVESKKIRKLLERDTICKQWEELL